MRADYLLKILKKEQECKDATKAEEEVRYSLGLEEQDKVTVL